MSENNCDVNNNQQKNNDIPKTQLEQVNNPQKQQNQIQQEKSPNNNGQNQLNGNNLSKEQKDNIIKNYELSIEYENSLRQEIELSTPLISEELPISILLDDYKSNNEYSTSIKQITDKYKYIRKVRRDGNCFYRSFIYRIFEYICIKNNKNLYEHIKKKISEAKEIIKRNGYDWTFIEDFHNIFYTEFYHCFNSLQTKGVSVRDYLDNLFSDKEKGNYLIYFIRFCIAAFLK